VPVCNFACDGIGFDCCGHCFDPLKMCDVRELVFVDFGQHLQSKSGM